MLPFAKPEYVKIPRHAIINSYVMHTVGLASDQVTGVVIDNRVALEQIHPTYILALLPLRNDIKIYWRDVLFYADCFAYEYEIPVLAYPKKMTMKIDFLLDRRHKINAKNSYFSALKDALESVTALRLGPLGYVEFRYDTSMYQYPIRKPVVRLSYSEKYQSVAKEIHLYTLALKQIDPLHEYLCYYRVIESIAENNGKNWLEKNFDRLPSYKFGFLPAGTDDQIPHRRINLFTVLRRRAVKHLRNLSKNMSYDDIAKRLYNKNRCGIAHGKSIRWLDFSADFEEVFLDVYLIKMMARLAIEDKLNTQGHFPSPKLYFS